VSAEALISRLEKCKRTGNGSWVACCPAHGDKHPSLTIRETEDGRVLVHCFAGCDVEQVIGAVGLDFDALFPPKPAADRLPAVRRAFPAADVLEAVAFECQLVAVAACNLGNGVTLSSVDHDRLLLAQSRIEEARRLALG
jgi:hypothetical protein